MNKINLSEREISDYLRIVSNWRACHAYPINTFQSTLRQKVKVIDSNALVAQRLKRFISIIKKLGRSKGMQLSRMQDIGGLRAVLSNITKVRKLENVYKKVSVNFAPSFN
ncbi:MAG: hypothetical protein K9M56_00915 [Victivallales bacterium]|nr:hypothetical protein [Victivallales bacterium]